MVRRFQYFGLLLAALLLAPGVNARPQRERVLPARPRAVIPRAPIGPPPNALEGRIAGLPPQWVEQLQGMRPAEQDRFLKNNARFRSLPPQRQAEIRQLVRAWNNLPPEQRQALLERQQIWEQLPQDQRRQVRETILPRWRTLPVARRQVILGKLRELRELDGPQRSAKLSDEAFLGSLNADERQMLRDLSNLGVG